MRDKVWKIAVCDDETVFLEKIQQLAANIILKEIYRQKSIVTTIQMLFCRAILWSMI